MDADSIGKQLMTSWAKLARSHNLSGTLNTIPNIPVYVELHGELYTVKDVMTSDKIVLKVKPKVYQD